MSDITLTNKKNLDLPFLVWLCMDEYDHNSDPNHVSATSLIKPVRQFVLNEKLPNTEVDVSSLIASRMGTAIHNSAEMSWLDKDNLTEALTLAGYPNRVIQLVKVNPTKEELSENPDIIPVFLEQRVGKEIDGFNISGKFDMVLNGDLYDYKSTSVYTYINNSNSQKYIEQASIYRYLNPEIITGDTITILFIFTDWSQAAQYSNPNYPDSRLKSVSYPLMSLQETERFIKNKIAEIKRTRTLEISELPLCSDEDLWVDPTKWKYYKDPNKTARSTKNFDEPSAAYAYKASKGEGMVLEVRGKVKACNYCNARPICTQYEQLKEEGRL